MTSKELKRVAIIGGTRTPFCRSFTAYKELTNLDLMITVLNGLAQKYHLENIHIDEVTGGAVNTHAKDWNLTREAVIGSTLAPSTPAITMMQACGTGLQAAMGIGAKIASGQIECGIALGSDSVSDPSISFGKKFTERMIKLSKARNMKQKRAAFKGFSFKELTPIPPSSKEPRTGLSMGDHCELMAKEWHISREDQDQLALASHQNGDKAYREGFMIDLLTPCAGIFQDNNLRPESSLEALSELKTAFDKTVFGTLTAGNSTPLTDGASAVLLASEDWAKQHNLPIIAYLTDAQTSAVDYVKGDGLLMAPTVAVARLLERNALSLQDFDLYEIHEAFAAQVLSTLTAWESEDYCKTQLGSAKALGKIDRTKLNVKGSSLAFGHPFAATGGRIIASLAKQLHEGKKQRGLISICTAGGMGVAAILEKA